MTIYVDVILIENLVINYIILYAVGIISKTNIKQIRLLIASLIGALYAVMQYIVNISIYSNFILKIILSIVIIYIAFDLKNIKLLIKKIILFYLVSFVFAGASLGIIYMVNSQNVTIQNGILVGSYTIKTILIGVIIAFIIIVTGFRIVKSKISQKDLICNIIINLNKQKIKTKAMIDTGNLLKEPITNIPVVVVEHTLLYDAIPKEILNNTEKILGGDFTDIPEDIQSEYISSLRVIPFSSLGKQNGMLLGIKINDLEVVSDEGSKIVDKVIMGIYNKSLTKRGEYRALVGLWAN